MWSALRSYARLYSGNRWALTGVIFLTALATLAVVPIPLLIKQALDVAIPEKRVALLFGLGAVLVGLQVANAVATVVRRRVVTAQTKAATRRLREAMIRKFYDTSIDYHRSAEIGTLQDWAVQETSRVDGMADSLLSGFIPALATSIGISVVLIVLNWQLYFLTMAVVPIIVLWHRTVMRGVRAANQRFRRAFRRYSDHVLFVLRTMDLTRIRAAEDLEMERSQRRLLDLEESDWSVTNARAMYSAGQQTLVAVSGIIILVFGGRAVIDGSLTVGDLFAFYAGLAMLKGPLTSTFTALPTIATGGQSLVQVYELLTEPDHRPYEGADDIEFSGRLSLVDVVFGYGRRPLIRRANLDLVPGRVTALVGLNGSGKSTIVSLMLGLYRPRDGVVLADGRPLHDLDIRTLRRSTGVVPQEPVIISGTIAANITYGSPNATQEEMRRAADLAQATGFVTDMEEGFDSWVTHEGLTLSGGQRQRIAIARALINEPRLLILDEPTTHLDEAILDGMLDTLVTLPTAPAILLISHQAGIDRWAHDVYRIEDGVLRKTKSTLNAATTTDGGAHEGQR